MERYLGKFRGTVVENLDPLRIGRVRAQVPDVLGDTPSTWAMPCFPVAGTQSGQYVVPIIGSGVWIEFEQGDINYPIWAGCWFGSSSEVPDAALNGSPESPTMLLQTRGGRAVVLSDLPAGDGITLRTADGAKIVINDEGILLSNGQGAEISLRGSTVSVNQGALDVT